MSRAYAHLKIREVMAEKNNKQEAAKDLIMLCAEDHEFLLGLTMPFLRGVIGHAINHAEKKGAEDELITEINLREQGDAAGIGIELVRSVLEEKGAKFGTVDRSKASLRKPSKASQAHIEALQQLAKKTDKTT